MRTKLLAVMGCWVVLASSMAFGYSGYKGEMQPEPVWVSPVAAAPQSTCQSCSNSTSGGCNSCSSIFTSACYSCSCTDPNCGSNPCMSSCRYCHAFGNVGDSDLGDPLL